MSNRFTNQSRNDCRSSSKTQKKFVPKRDPQTPNYQQTLSNSLRDITSSASGSGGDDVVESMSRVRIGEDGELVNKASSSGKFVIYLPQDEAVAVGFGPEEGGLDPEDSQRIVDLLNRELSRLLKLHPRDFWREVATDESLHSFLESFLKFRSRWYDFPYRGARGKVAGVIVGESELCRRVFMVFYRLSSNRDPGAKAADSLSPKEHEALLQDKKLLDLPKLLDICAIYGHVNEDLTRLLVTNAMMAQPYIQHDFPVLLSHFLSIARTMYQRCNSTLEVLFNSGGQQDQGSNRLHLDYLEIMDFINDSVLSLDSFVTSYKPAAVFFSSPIEMSYGSEELLTTLARLHDSLLPSLQRGFHIILGVAEDKNKEIPSDLLSNVFSSLKMLSTRIANFGWKLLYLCYFGDEAFEMTYSLPVSMKMFPANVEDPAVRADILIQTIRDLTVDHTHIPGGQTWGTFIQNIEKNHQMLSRIELLQKAGWLSMDNEQFQFLSGIMIAPRPTDNKQKSSTSIHSTSKKAQADEDAAILESKISQIKELFPDHGRVFLVACLEAYNHDPEEVIQRILDGSLHKELQSLDISLETVLPSKAVASSMSRNDKGKGKLVESAIFTQEVVVPPTVVKNQAQVSSSSSSGRFVRKNTDDPSEFETLNDRKQKELAKTAVLASQLEYEDEYDDSFDDLGLSVGDSGLDEPESLVENMDSQKGRSTGADGDNAKWGSRKKPQFYVKDGRNYSYKVEGSVAVANFNEAKIVNQAQKELVHGLGRGGNIPLGAVKRLTESQEEQNGEKDAGEIGGRGFGRGRGRRGFVYHEDREVEQDNNEGGGGRGNFRGRGRRGFVYHEDREVEQDNNEGGGGRGNFRGRGRRGFIPRTGRGYEESNEDQEGEQDNDEGGGRGNFRGRGRRGRGRNQFRKERGMSKHFSGIPGHYS